MGTRISEVIENQDTEYTRAWAWRKVVPRAGFYDRPILVDDNHVVRMVTSAELRSSKIWIKLHVFLFITNLQGRFLDLEAFTEEVGRQLNGFSSSLSIEFVGIITTSSTETMNHIVKANVLTLLTERLLGQDFHVFSHVRLILGRKSENRSTSLFSILDINKGRMHQRGTNKEGDCRSQLDSNLGAPTETNQSGSINTTFLEILDRTFDIRGNLQKVLDQYRKKKYSFSLLNHLQLQ